MVNFTIVPTVTILSLVPYGYLNEINLNGVNLLINPDPKLLRTTIYAQCIKKGYNLLVYDHNEIRLITHMNPRHGIGMSINWRHAEERFRQGEYSGVYLLLKSPKSEFLQLSAKRYHVLEYILTHPEEFETQPRDEELEKIFSNILK